MATLPPDELLKLWKLEQLPLEMSMGHVLQNLANLRAAVATQYAALTSLRMDVDRLIAHTGLPPSTKGKPKMPKPDETIDPGQPS